MVILPCMDVTNGDTYRISYWRRSNSGAMAGVFSGTTGQNAASMTDILPM